MKGAKHKYKVGDKVAYTDEVCSSEVCKECGHEERDWKEVKRTGTITSLTEHYCLGNGPVINNVCETLPNGDTVYRPEVAEMKVQEKEPFYTINGEDVHEGSILKR
jgi:hypothetical protein